jgi:hypothetical protein
MEWQRAGGRGQGAGQVGLQVESKGQRAWQRSEQVEQEKRIQTIRGGRLRWEQFTSEGSAEGRGQQSRGQRSESMIRGYRAESREQSAGE